MDNKILALMPLMLAIVIVSGCVSEEVEPEREVEDVSKSETAKAEPEQSEAISQPEPETANETRLEEGQTGQVQVQEELVPISFIVDALDTDDLDIRFPAFWGAYRMDDVDMVKKGAFFEATVNLPKNSLISYEFECNCPTEDFWSNREQFRPDEEPNRMVHVTQPVVIWDKVYSWGPSDVERPIRLFGKITDKATGEPIVEAVIVGDGIITFPTGDGSYNLNIRSGEHQVIVYLLDGSYKTKSQVHEFNGDKELNFELEKAKRAKVNIRIDASPPPYHKVRIYTTAEQTGARFLYSNRFLTENFKTIDNEIELVLHEGQYVDYLYSVGNPAISFENKDGQHVVRHFIAKDGLIIEDKVGSFSHPNTRTLKVKVPDYTDSKDIIGIKEIHPTLLFMHPKGNNEWVLSLGGHLSPEAEYRYYKSFIGEGDERTKKRNLASFSGLDEVEAWKFQTKPLQKTAVSVPEIKNEFEIFAYPFDYHSSNTAILMENEIGTISEKGYHGIVLSQIWGYEMLEPTPKISRFKPMTLYAHAFELRRLSKEAHDKGLRVFLYPQLVGAESFLGEGGPKTFSDQWWGTWLQEIEKFNLYNARTAQEAGIEFLMFQGRSPGMNMPDSYKQTYEKKQKEVMAKMRSIFTGKIIAQADLEEGIDYWKDADIVTQKIWDHLVADKEASQEEIEIAVAKLLDTKYKPIRDKSGKPFLIDQLAYSSLDGASTGLTVPESEGANTDFHYKYPLDLEEQRRIHEAFYKAINLRNWIVGVNLFGYGFTDTPEDREVNPRAKPAEDVATAWAKKISGK